jgi:signal transduction histidine kinase
VGVVVVLPDGSVLSANRAAERTGLDYFEPNGPLQTVLAEGGSSEQEMRVVDEDSSARLLRATATAIRGSHGGHLAAVLVVQDLTVERLALEQAESAVRARENVLAVVSHDLRSPLNAISIAAKELAEDDLDDGERRHYAAAIGRGLERCSRLIDDLLDASALQGGRMKVTPQTTEARALLLRVGADHAAYAATIGVTLTVDAPDDLGSALIDPDRMHQALGNLIGNALQHTPRGGRVVLGGQVSADRVTFTVTDTGAGISAEDLPRVFELYWQARRTRRGSAGLGLAIVRGIVEAHGGYVAVASLPGEGATFSIVLPV